MHIYGSIGLVVDIIVSKVVGKLVGKVVSRIPGSADRVWVNS
jgi:hypothetical protein